MDHLELLDGGLFAESSLLDDIPAQKPRSADLAEIEADTQRYLGRLLIKKEERMAIISQLSGLLTKEKIDAEVATLVKYFLQYLLQDSQNLQYLGDSHRN